MSIHTMGVTRGKRNLLGANQRHWVCVLIVFSLGAVHADFPLEHLLPRIAIYDRQNKIWFHYIENFFWMQLVHKETNKSVYFKSYFLLQLWKSSKYVLSHSKSDEDSFSSFQQVKDSRAVPAQNIMWMKIGKKQTDELSTKASDKLQQTTIPQHFFVILSASTMVAYKVIHTWQFSLQKLLSINISFASMSFPTGSTGCNEGHLSVIQLENPKSPGQEANLIYCGEHSSFNVYPASTSVVVKNEHMLFQTIEADGSFSVCNKHKVISFSTSHSGNFK